MQKGTGLNEPRTERHFFFTQFIERVLLLQREKEEETDGTGKSVEQLQKQRVSFARAAAAAAAARWQQVCQNTYGPVSSNSHPTYNRTPQTSPVDSYIRQNGY
jgi:hypothetical protein